VEERLEEQVGARGRQPYVSYGRILEILEVDGVGLQQQSNDLAYARWYVVLATLDDGEASFESFVERQSRIVGPQSSQLFRHEDLDDQTPQNLQLSDSSRRDDVRIVADDLIIILLIVSVPIAVHERVLIV
jgi:hypothetical protein